MKDKFLKSILIMSFLVFLIIAGCQQTQPLPPQPTGPTTCTLTIYSQCFACWGYVWVNGLSTGKYIDTNGMVQVSVPCGVAAVQIVDEFGNYSHQEIVQTPQTSIVIFTYFW